MNKKIIAVICASLLIVSVVLTSCGKKVPTISANGEEYAVVTDAEGSTVVDDVGDIYVYVTDESGNVVKTDDGEDETAVVTFPELLANGTLYETKYFKMTYPEGWTVNANGTATSDKYPGVSILLQYLGAVSDADTLDTLTAQGYYEIQSINEQATQQYPDVTATKENVTLTKSGVEAQVIKWKVPDPAQNNKITAYQETMTFIYNGNEFHVQYILEKGYDYDADLNMVDMFSQGLEMK